MTAHVAQAKKAEGHCMPDLVSRCIAGDSVAQRELYQKYRHIVVAALHKMLYGEELDDAIQEAFIAIFHSLPQFKGQAKLSSWIYRICINVAIQLNRKNKRRRQTFLPLLDGQESDPPLYTLQHRTTTHLVYRILDGIAAKKRVVFILNDIVGLSTAEIATILDCHPMTVRTRLHYARKELYTAIHRSLE